MSDVSSRLRNYEDGFTERKPDGANRAELRRTIVAFANSVPDDRSAVLFVGVRDDGRVTGVTNPDKIQKTIREICETDAYPAIVFQSEVVDYSGKPVVAVVVPASQSRPHFAGPAFVRCGSESVAASADAYEELLASRSDKCRYMLRHRDDVVTITARGGPLGDRSLRHDPGYLATHRGRIRECDAQHVRLLDFETNTLVSVPLEDVRIAYDAKLHQLELIVDHPIV